MDYMEYLKIPFLHGGTSTSGADCFGFLKIFYSRELGIELEDSPVEYEEFWWKDHNYCIDFYKEFGFRKVSIIKPFDMLFFNSGFNKVGHIGVALDGYSFIHMCRTGPSINNYVTGVWGRQLDSAYRFNMRKKVI